MRTLLRDGAEEAFSAEAWAARMAAKIRGQGYYVETFDRNQVISTSVLTDGSIYYTSCGFHKGDLISNLTVDVNAGGVATSLAKLGVVSLSGALLAISADASASFNTSGTKTLPMLTPYRVLDDDELFLALVVKTATTMPGIVRGGGAAGGLGIGGSAGAPRGIMTGQTDIPSSSTIVFGSGSAAPVWIGVS